MLPAATEAAMTLSSDVHSSETERPIVSDNTLALVVYLLYGLGYFTVISALVGVVIAHVRIADADPALRSHYQFQIRTFWIGVLYFTIGFPLCLLMIGFPILIWWFVWSVIRVVKGIILLNEHKPVANPKSWLFG
jgi:uncharacterized membrane protein